MANDSPSPVRASAQETTARSIAESVFGAGAMDESQALLHEVAVTSLTARLERELAAAEARGRQQAEQALQAKFDVLDEQWGHYPASFASLMDSIDSKSLEAGVENFVLWHSKKREAAESRVAALTQALKDYGQHRPSCEVTATHGMPRVACTCGWDAALSGATR